MHLGLLGAVGADLLDLLHTPLELREDGLGAEPLQELLVLGLDLLGRVEVLALEILDLLIGERREILWHLRKQLVVHDASLDTSENASGAYGSD